MATGSSASAASPVILRLTAASLTAGVGSRILQRVCGGQHVLRDREEQGSHQQERPAHVFEADLEAARTARARPVEGFVESRSAEAVQATVRSETNGLFI